MRQWRLKHGGDVPRQELMHPLDRMRGDALYHIAQIRLGVEAVQLCATDQAVDRSCALTASI